MPSSREDPFLYDCLPCLMPNSFMPFSEPQSLPSLDTDALHRILRQQAMKNASEDAEQANAILRSITSSCNTEIGGDMTLFCKPKSRPSGTMERVAFQPMSLKENRRPRRDGTGRVSTRRPFTVNLSSFGSNVNTERDPSIVQDVDEFWAAAERREIAEAIAQKLRGEKSPGLHCAETLKTRVRRQGSGRKASSRNFDVKFEDYYAEKYASIDLEKLEEEEYPAPTFTDNEGQAGETPTENGNIEIRKDSPRKELMQDGHEEYPCEAVNEMIQPEEEPQLDGIRQSDLQAHGGEVDGLHANAVQQKEMSCGFEADETVNMPPKNLLSSCQSSTVKAAYILLQDYLKLDAENMQKVPVSRSELGFSDIGQSYLKGLQCDMLNPLSQSQAESSNTIYSGSWLADKAKDMPMLQQCSKTFHLAVSEMPSENFRQKVAKASSSLTSTALPSSLPMALQWPRNPVNSDQAMFQDANKPSIKNMDEEMGAETPAEYFHQKAAEACSPSTSPTPPSNLYAALKRLRKHRSGVQAMFQNTNKPSIINMDEEKANACISSPSPNMNNPSIKNKGEEMANVCTFSPSPNMNKPSIKNIDEEMANACTFSSSPNTNAIDISSPLKQREDIGIRRLSFGSASELPMQDEFYSEEGLNVASGMNVFHAPSFTNEGTQEGKVEAVRSNMEIPCDTLLGTDECNPSRSCHTDILKPAVKDVISASARQVEESPVALHKKNAKKLKVKEQLNSETTTLQCNLPVEDQIASPKLGDKEGNKRKSKFQRRQSLAGAGTLWKGGVRRSTRIRSRPLEYWRGERFLYGRIHSSLSTVIGIKYSSPLPTKPKKGYVPQFKVESYVGEQYSDLVEFAALH